MQPSNLAFSALLMTYSVCNSSKLYTHLDGRHKSLYNFCGMRKFIRNENPDRWVGVAGVRERSSSAVEGAIYQVAQESFVDLIYGDVGEVRAERIIDFLLEECPLAA